MISFFVSTAGTALGGLFVVPFIRSGTVTTGMIKVDTVCMTEKLPLSPCVGVGVGLCRRSWVAGLMTSLLCFLVD